jgi:MinD-like ATPase involved in chromosome partitioning or flagellar assembly
MAVVAVCGDTATTSSVALAAAWPAHDELLLVEADPVGGDMAAWFDVPAQPSLSTVVTRLLDGSWAEIQQHTQLTPSGIRVVPAPVANTEAARAVAESGRGLMPSLAAMRSPVTVVDVGRAPVAPSGHPAVAVAAVTVLVHRQAPQSAAAAAVRLERFGQQLAVASAAPSPAVAVVVGTRPFDLAEVSRFLSGAVGELPIVGLPVDDLAAAVLAGRPGVSARRLARLPLMRAARELATVVRQAHDEHVGTSWQVRP